MSRHKRRPLSERIARFAVSLKLEEVPQTILEHGKLLLMDTFGAAMACQDMAHATTVRRAVEQMGSAPQCTLWGTESKVQAADASLYNACLIHGADYDDTHVGGIVHPSAPVISTAMTVGEYVGASGSGMFEAIVAGWEIIVRLALAAKGRFHDVGYHGTGILAPFAAACVAGRLQNLSADVLTNALGICGSQAAALQEFLHDGTWAKKIHPGWGSHSAIYALSMARYGFAGPQRVFEGEYGLWKTHIGDTDGLEEAFSDLGRVWHTGEITIKRYPVCHMTHSFIDCTIALMKENSLTAGDIARIECRIEPRCYHIVCEPPEAKLRPTTDYGMRFSLPYVVAVAAVFGRVSAQEIDVKIAQDPQILTLVDRIQCVKDEAMRNPGYFPGWVKIMTNDGNTYIKDQRYETGSAQNPIRMDDVEDKLDSNLEPFYSLRRRKRLIEQIKTFERLDNSSSLIKNLVPDRVKGGDG